MQKLVFRAVLVFLIVLSSRGFSSDEGNDSLWLEEHSHRTTNWVAQQNEKVSDFISQTTFSDIVYDKLASLGDAILASPIFMVANEKVFRLKRTEAFGRTNIVQSRSIVSSAPNQWVDHLNFNELIPTLEADQLLTALDCHEGGTYCLAHFSSDGEETTQIYEIDFINGEVQENGFYFEKGNWETAWLGKDVVLVRHNGGGTHKFPEQDYYLYDRDRNIKRIQLQEGDIYPVRGGREKAAIAVRPTEAGYEHFYLTNDAIKQPLNLPPYLRVIDAANSNAWLISTEMFTVPDGNGSEIQIHPKSLFVVDLEELVGGSGSVSLVKTMDSFDFLDSSRLLHGKTVSASINVVNGQDKLALIQKDSRSNDWHIINIEELPAASIQLEYLYPYSDDLVVSHEDFTTPQTQYYLNAGSISSGYQPTLVPFYTQRSTFDETDISVEYRYAESSDGQTIPYVVVYKGKLSDTPRPTLLTAYGGHGVIYPKKYLVDEGPLWLEKGGVFVFADVRGGGEYGVYWEYGAKELRKEKAIEDLVSVAKTLVSEGVTTSEKLAAFGHSHGGFLVLAAAAKEPKLFEAVVAHAPITDLMRLPTLDQGKFIDEFGDASNVDNVTIINENSPLHIVRKLKHFPSSLIVAATNDERVNPAHSRKFVSVLNEINASPLYRETKTGGHAGYFTYQQKLSFLQLKYTFLYDRLGIETP